VGFAEPRELVEQPIPLVPVAQLQRGDVPDFAGPDGTDLLQVLWCPLDHPEDGYNPRVELYWRRGADVTRPLIAAPEPPVVCDSYLPVQCVVHPEQVREFQYLGLLPDELAARLRGHRYHKDLSLAPGWKVGGFANWSLTDPHPMRCAECGATMTLLFTAASNEWHGADSSWRPAEEPTDAVRNPVGVSIGRSYDLYVFRCPTSFDHPPKTVTQ
jgi:hypothetical protein